MSSKDGDFTFEIKEHLGVINTYTTGWKKELNIVQWNGGSQKYDIRDWDPEHEHMGKGVTLREEEAKKLVDFICRHFEKQPNTEIKENL